MEIDLLEDRVCRHQLMNCGFTLYELYEMKEQLNRLQDIKEQMIDNTRFMGLKDSLVLHHNHMGVILDNQIEVAYLIEHMESGLFQSFGKFGDMSLN